MTSREGAKGVTPTQSDDDPISPKTSSVDQTGGDDGQTRPVDRSNDPEADPSTGQPSGPSKGRSGPRAERQGRSGPGGSKGRADPERSPGARRAARLAAARGETPAQEDTPKKAAGPSARAAAARRSETEKPSAPPEDAAADQQPEPAKTESTKSKRSAKGENRSAGKVRAQVPVPVKGDAVPAKLSGGGVPSTKVKSKPDGNAEMPKSPVLPAKVRRRHRWMVLSFVLLVLVPVAGTFYYLFEHAQDRYASNAAFFVHREDTTSSVESVFGLAGVGGGGNTPDADVLYQYIQSQQMVELANERLDLRSLYTAPYEVDPYFALNPDATLEEMVKYWDRVVSMVFAPDNGLITLEVIAYDPQSAQALAQVILDECARLIDRLSQIAQEDTVSQAQNDLVLAEERLKAARIAIAEFRSDTDFVDPSAGVAGAEGLITALQQELAAELINRDTLIGTTTRDDDPRIERADRKIASIRQRIQEERNKVGSDQAAAVGAYEELLVNRQFAEQSYTAALAAYDGAVAEARRKSRYLAIHIEPTLADTAVYPQRITLGLVAAAFIFMAWAILMLVVYSFHDRR